jgi:hypothetical protein
VSLAHQNTRKLNQTSIKALVYTFIVFYLIDLHLKVLNCFFSIIKKVLCVQSKMGQNFPADKLAVYGFVNELQNLSYIELIIIYAIVYAKLNNLF